MKLGHLLLLMSLAHLAQAKDHKYMVLVGTYTDSGSKGIYSFPFNGDKGSVGSVHLAAASENPSFLAIDRGKRIVYAANEIHKFQGRTDGSVSAFALEEATGELREVQQASSGGWGPVYLSFDQTGRYLFVADYGAGNVAVLPVAEDGRLGDPTDVATHVGTKERPARPHSVIGSPDDRFVLVPDLGLNKLFVYRFDSKSGKLEESPGFTFDHPVGPRHLVIAPSGKFVYLANEEASSVTAFAWNQALGRLKELQTIATVAEGSTVPNTAAEIKLDQSSGFLYVSNRGEDTIAIFRTGSDGRLKLIGRSPVGGKTPRSFSIDPTGNWVFVANQGSGTVNLLKRDPETGRLSTTSTIVRIAAPSYIVFVPLQ